MPVRRLYARGQPGTYSLSSPTGYSGFSQRTPVLLHVALLAVALSACVLSRTGAESIPPDRLRTLERSYWVSATLGTSIVRGYWHPNAAAGPPPADEEIRAAARLLCGHYGANRLYLIYHREVLPAEARRVFLAWRRACPPAVELVPTLVLLMYDGKQTPVFGPIELRSLLRFFKQSVNPRMAAVYDVQHLRDAGPLLRVMAEEYPDGLMRVGIQPDEPIAPPFSSAVQDTWSGLCHGKTNEDWMSPGFGAGTLKQWLEARNNQQRPVAWDLVAVAWDYAPTERGEYPGYDDAAKNMPLPAGRNRLAARLMLQTARPEVFAGFSSDLFIVQTNSIHSARDGRDKAFYQWLKRGTAYRGAFSEPLEEIAAIYRSLRAGLMP